MERLVLICEGGAHSVEYFHKNMVYPGAVVLTTTKFKEMAPYLTKEDSVLLVIKGLTDFSMAEVYALLNDFDELGEKVGQITIMSNINLGKIATPYYLYTGDLFYGTVREMKNGKPVEKSKKVTEEEKEKKKHKKKNNSEETKPELHVNEVMEKFKVYNRRDVKFTIYGSTTREQASSYEQDIITSKLVAVDLFVNKPPIPIVVDK